MAVIRRGQGTRPDVLHLQVAGQDLVLKDQNGCDTAFAVLLGPLLAWREARSLSRLRDLAGVPRLLERPDQRSLLLQYVPAVPIKRAPAQDWPRFFQALQELVAAMHACGVAHCDLRSPGNTLVDESGRPVLVDFVASVHRGRRWNIASRLIFRLFCQADERAILKLKHIVAPGLLTPEELPHISHRAPWQRALRAIGRGLRALARGLFTRQR